jgi:hypothetical protein
VKFRVKAYRIETLTQTVVSDTPEEAIEKAKAQPNDWYPGPFDSRDPGWAYGVDTFDVHVVAE